MPLASAPERREAPPPPALSFEFRASSPFQRILEVFQNCVKSLYNWVAKGSLLSESRIPELVQDHGKEGDEESGWKRVACLQSERSQVRILPGAPFPLLRQQLTIRRAAHALSGAFASNAAARH